MTNRILTSVCLIALLSACSHQADVPMAPADAAHAAYLSGDMQAAERGYIAALSADPNNAAALLGMGEVMQATGRFAEASELYQRAEAIRSGNIRVWNGGMQDGVTEVATRNLGGMMGNTAANTAPAYTPPMPATMQESHAQDGEDMGYYADPEATQPIPAELFEAPQDAMIGTTAMPAVYTPAPVMIQEAAPMQYESAPMTYEAAPMQYESAPMIHEAAPMQYETAPMIHEAAPMQYETAPMIQEAAPMQYEPAPMIQEAAPMQYETAPMIQEAAPMQYEPAPMPTTKPMVEHTASDDYTVVNGVVEYATAPKQTPIPAKAASVSYETMPAGYGTPTDVIRTGLPISEPKGLSAPRGTYTEDGIPMIDLH